MLPFFPVLPTGNTDTTLTFAVGHFDECPRSEPLRTGAVLQAGYESDAGVKMIRVDRVDLR
jgi:hypothetical protein